MAPQSFQQHGHSSNQSFWRNTREGEHNYWTVNAINNLVV